MKALQPSDPPEVGRYRLLGWLGSGGMGQVFLGQSPGGRLVAVKLIRTELAADPEFRARFAREVAAARHVSGMFTAAVVDADPDGPQPWLVTAYVPGPSLADAVTRHGPLPIRSLLTLTAGLAEGLGVIHAEGMIHRDLKPSNVLLASDGPRIIDFGISRAADATALTNADRVVGSPGFMSPEQAQGHEVGPSSDVFSLGAVLTFAATGDGPFGTGSATALLYRVVHDPPATGRLPGQIRPLIEDCLAKEPWRRPTPEQLLAALGTAQPAADWLPWPPGQEAAGYLQAQPLPAPLPVNGIRGPWPGTPERAPAAGPPGPGPAAGPPGWGPAAPPPGWGPAAPPPGRGPAAPPPGRGPAAPPPGRGPAARPPDWRPAAKAPGPGPAPGPRKWRPAAKAPGPGPAPGPRKWRPAAKAPGRGPAPGAASWEPPAGSAGGAAAGWRSAPRTTDVMAPFAAPGQPARPKPRRRLGPWAVALLVMALTGSVFAAAHSSPSLTSGRGTVAAAPRPRAVVLAYFAAINRHDWHRVWALGGMNLGRSYRAMVAGYRLTAHDDVTSLRVRGDTVFVHLLAHQTTGAVRTYRMRYVVHDGIITAGDTLPVGTN